MRIPTLISLTLAALGLAHVLIVCMAEGWVHGYHHVLNDPGKVVFHLALLPAAVWVFANRLPTRVITTALSSHRAVAMGSAAFLIAVATLIVVKDAQESVCVRLATPFQFKATARQGLAALYFELHTLHSELRKAHELSELCQPLPPQCPNRAKPACDKSVDAPTLKRLWSEHARNCYLTRLGESRIGNDADVRKGGDCKYWVVAGWQNAWNALLSFLGTVFVLSVFWVISLHAFTRIRLDEETFTTLAVVALLLVPWMAFRMYSEWYLNFGYFDFSNYPLIYVAFIFTIAVAFVIIVL